MELDIVVPLRRRATLHRLLHSLARNTVRPDAVWLVTNDIDAEDVDPCGLDVRVVRSESTHYGIGCQDAALRRDIGIWASTASHVMTFDDDQVAPADLVESTRRVLSHAPVCWGHHRFIDFDAQPLDDLLALPPGAGRTREMPPNAWHSWRSAYAGLFASERSLVQRVGGFDLIYNGRHGGEDQDLGRRLAAALGHGDAIYVHEPPFAWHPERNTAWDEPVRSNLCVGPHDMIEREVDGVWVHACARCPFQWVPESSFTHGDVRMRFDPARVSIDVEPVPELVAHRSITDVLPLLTPHALSVAELRLQHPFDAYVSHISSPDMTISLRMAAFLWCLCEALGALRVLDLGSGFSSYVFRDSLQQRGGRVFTADDDRAWLDRSRDFVTAHGWGDDGFYPWKSVPAWHHGPYDVVFYDLGSMATRRECLDEVMSSIGRATLVLNDMHKDEYAPSVRAGLATGTLNYVDARALTIDHFGRFAGVVERRRVSAPRGDQRPA